MEAVILAGGFGTRLRPVINNLPKPMAPINNKPFLEILMRNLDRKGFERVVFSLHYMPEKIISYFNDSFLGMEIDYIIEDIPLGTGGAIKNSFNKVKSDQVYIFNGDSYVDFNFKSTEALREEVNAPIILLKQLKNINRYGSVKIKDRLIIGFEEKNNSGPGFINAGVYIINKNLLNDFPSQKQFSFEKDYLTKKVNESPHYYYICEGDFIDIGVPNDFNRAQEMFK